MLRKLLLATALALSAIPAEAVQYYGYPANAVPLVEASANLPDDDVVITFDAVPGWVNYLTHVTCMGAGATAASVVIATLVGTLGDAQNYIVAVPAGATTRIEPVDLYFDPPLVANANTAITFTLPALGVGNTHAACSMQGFRIIAN